jgi:hypothetical protein
VIARFLFIALFVESLAGCAGGRPRAYTEDLVVAAVLRDVIADEPRWGTPLICAQSRADPTAALLDLVRSNTTFEVGVCSDLTGDPADSLLAVTRVTGARAYIVFWNEVVQRELQEYEVQAGFSCGFTCGKLYQYRVGKSEGAWRVLGKVLLSVS